MSTWAAFAAKGAAAAATTAAGAGTAQAITPAALDGFAAGTLLTGMCYLVVVAPRTMRKSRLSARQSLWSAARRHDKARPDYYAAPADTHSTAVAPDLAAPVLIGPALDAFLLAAPVAAPASAAAAAAAAAATTQATAAGGPMPPAPLTDIPQPQLPLAFADPALEVFAPNAGNDYAGHAGADPYAPGVLDPVDYTPPTSAGTDSASSSASNPAFDPGSDDDIVLPGDDDAAQRGGRGYRSKHRLTGQDADRRSDPKRKQPRHAAPPTRFGSRMSGRLAIFPLAPARS